MDTLYFVTIPRSAYHLLSKRLNFYFGESLGQFESARYRPAEMKKAIDNGDRLIGCHDYGLTRRWLLRRLMEFPKDPGRKHVVLFRNPLPSLVSCFRLKERNDWKRKGALEEWRSYSLEMVEYMKRFIRKWVMDEGFDAKLRIACEQIAQTPEESLIATIEYMSEGDVSADRQQVSKCIERYPFIEPALLEDFEYYDRAFFVQLRERLGEVGDFLENEEGFRIRFDIP